MTRPLAILLLAASAYAGAQTMPMNVFAVEGKWVPEHFEMANGVPAPVNIYGYPPPTPAIVVPNDPHCTQPFWYQQVCDGNWNWADPANAGHVTPSGCGSHHYLVADDTGANVTIIGQCPDPAHPCVGTQNLYKKPDHPSAALDAWNWFYTDPQALLHRTLFHYYGPGVPPAGLQVLTPYKTLAQLPDPPRSAKAQAYGCNGTPTPSPIPSTPTRTPTPAPNQFARYVVWVTDKGIMAGCGGNLFCPGTPVNGLLTRAQYAATAFNQFRVDHPSEPLPVCRNIYADVVCP